jgi:hypothetical protein
MNKTQKVVIFSTVFVLFDIALIAAIVLPAHSGNGALTSTVQQRKPAPMMKPAQASPIPAPVFIPPAAVVEGTEHVVLMRPLPAGPASD